MNEVEPCDTLLGRALPLNYLSTKSIFTKFIYRRRPVLPSSASENESSILPKLYLPILSEPLFGINARQSCPPPREPAKKIPVFFFLTRGIKLSSSGGVGGSLFEPTWAFLASFFFLGGGGGFFFFEEHVFFSTRGTGLFLAAGFGKRGDGFPKETCEHFHACAFGSGSCFSGHRTLGWGGGGFSLSLDRRFLLKVGLDSLFSRWGYICFLLGMVKLAF